MLRFRFSSRDQGISTMGHRPESPEEGFGDKEEKCEKGNIEMELKRNWQSTLNGSEGELESSALSSRKHFIGVDKTPIKVQMNNYYEEIEKGKEKKGKKRKIK